jgi:hypothetical protein
MCWRMPADKVAASSPPSLPPPSLRTTPQLRGAQRRVADQLRPELPKLAGFMDEAESDVLAYMSVPASRQAALDQPA